MRLTREDATNLGFSKKLIIDRNVKFYKIIYSILIKCRT